MAKDRERRKSISFSLNTPRAMMPSTFWGSPKVSRTKETSYWSVIICTRQDREDSRTLCRSGRMIRQSATPMTKWVLCSAARRCRGDT